MYTMLAVGGKELRQVWRDPRTLLILLFIPAFFLLLYGYALNFDIRHIALAVQDRDGTPKSRELISGFVNSGYFDLAAVARSEADIERLMNTNEIRAALVIPEDLGRRVRAGERATVQVLINGDNANTATTVMGYALRIVTSISGQLQPEQRIVERAPPLTIEPRVWFNPELRSTLFLVPGLIAYIAMITAVVSTALSVVREKERGTMEQVRMAPVGTAAFIIGKTIPYFGISLASAVGVVLASMALFDLPMRGSWMQLLLALSLYLVGALGTGLFVSTVADSQQMAFQMAIVVAFLPTLILSGFIFPISSMPGFVQLLTYVVPARYFLVALRSIVLKGAGPAAFWPDLVALAVYATSVMALASVRLARERR
ncbi:MAG: ABC transporter permease [Acidobacteria bacterium]|nr:ABC transporter permease [Acidobacteriota bacterium]